MCRGFSNADGIGQRLASVRRAFPDGAFPPISVFEIGGSYFVSDGHKRVAVAREMGIDLIDISRELVSSVEPDHLGDEDRVLLCSKSAS